MVKKCLIFGFCLIAAIAYSDDNLLSDCSQVNKDFCIQNTYHDNYISINNYIQNPYNHSPSAGGTQVLTESDIANKTKWQQSWTNGTYNAVGLASWSVLNVPNNNYAYGVNLFAQSGHVDGFAVGSLFKAVNPFLQPGYS